jgi:hypothetical protein
MIDRWNCLRLPASRLDLQARRHLEGARIATSMTEPLLVAIYTAPDRPSC